MSVCEDPKNLGLLAGVKMRYSKFAACRPFFFWAASLPYTASF
jgi:hypothetical protein